MNSLLAHHLEVQHFPILILLFAAGVYVGWELLGRLLALNRSTTDEPNR